MIQKLKFLIIMAVLAVAAIAGWQVGASEIANLEFQDDLRAMSIKLGTRIGYSAPKSDDDYRDAIIKEADGYGIKLTPEQVTIEHSGSEGSETLTLTVDYTVKIKVPGYSFPMHFTPTSVRV